MSAVEPVGAAGGGAQAAGSHARATSYMGPLFLLGASAIWGGMYPIMKVALATVPTSTLVVCEYGLASAIMLPLAGRRLLRVPRALRLRLLITGLLWLAAVTLVFLGLRSTSPGLAAFIVVQNAVVTPILVGLSGKGWFDRRLGLAIVLVITGMALIVLVGERSAVSASTALIGVAVVLLSLHMIVVGRLTHEVDAAVLVAAQVTITAVGALAVSLGTWSWPAFGRGFEGATLAAVLYGGIGSSLLAVLLQTLGQRRTPVTHVGVFLSLESVFALVLSLLLGADHLELRTLAGFVLILAGTLTAQLSARDTLRSAGVDEPLDLASPL